MGRRKNTAHKSARMPVTRGLSLRSRVPGNWHARFWSRGGGSDFLIYCNQPYLPSVDSRPILNRLVNMHFARREAERYYLHPVDQAYALGRIPKGDEFDRDKMAERPSSPDTRCGIGRRIILKKCASRARNGRRSTIWPRNSRSSTCGVKGRITTRRPACCWILTSIICCSGATLRRVVELHERLRGKLSNSELNGSSLGNLGIAYARIGTNSRRLLSVTSRP